MLILAKNKINAEELTKVVTPTATDTHTPIPHHQLVDLTRAALGRAGLEIKEEEHAIARGGLRYFGGFSLAGETIKGEDRNIVLGLRNAHDKSFPAGICAGDAPFVCDNLIFTNTIKLARRHTLNILNDLNFTINRAIGQLFEFWNGQDERINAYKNREISNTEAHDLTILACKAGALPKSKIMDVVDQWESSDHPEFWDRNVNSLYNAFTEVYKGNLTALPTRSQALHSVLDNAVSFDISNHVHDVTDMAVIENELVEV